MGLLSLLSPGEIGSPWSSFHTATGQVAFHPVHFGYGASGINLSGSFGLFIFSIDFLKFRITTFVFLNLIVMLVKHKFFEPLRVNPVRNSSPAIAGLETERGIISNGVKIKISLEVSNGRNMLLHLVKNAFHVTLQG